MSDHRPLGVRAIAIATALAVGAAGVALAPPQHAEEAAKGSVAEARKHMDRGQAFFLEKKFAEAAAEFRKAYEIKPFSTFLFNEAVCHEKLRELDEAIRLFEKYVDVDPQAPDRKAVDARIAKLEAERDAAKVPDAGPSDAGGDAAADAAVDAAPVTPPQPPPTANIEEMRSMVVVESVPEGAPVEIWQRTDKFAPKFEIGGSNSGWTKVVTGTTTLTQSLPLGTYHVVIPKFQDYRATETDVVVAPATISQFKANLAQGAFFGVVKVRSFGDEGEVRGAHVFVKKPGTKSFVDRGVTPYEESLESGVYDIRVELPGFEPVTRQVEVVHGKIDEQKFELDRSGDGLVRVEVENADRAEVIVDDSVVGTWTDGARVEAKVRAGAHRVKVKADDRKTYVADVDVPRGKMIVLHAQLKPSVPRGAAWTTLVASAVFFGAGAFLGVKSNSDRDALDTALATHRLDQEDPRIKRGKYYAIAADGCFVVGGVLALISIYDFVKDPLPPSKGWREPARDLDVTPAAPRKAAKVADVVGPAFRVRVEPMAGVGFAGLSLVGAF